MINVIENYRLALAKRKAARKAEAKAHKHAKRVAAYHDGIRKMLAEDQAWREQREREVYHDRLRALAAAERAETARIHAMREQAEREDERNEFAGLTRITLRSNDHD